MMRLLGNTASALIGADEAQNIEHPEHVGPELDAGADLLEFRRLLDDLRGDALARQRQSRREPADAAADDEDLLVFPIAHCTLSCARIVEAGWIGTRAAAFPLRAGAALKPA